MDGDLERSTISLGLGKLVDVDGELLSINLDDFSSGTLVTSSDNCHLIVLPDGDGSDSVLFPQVLGE